MAGSDALAAHPSAVSPRLKLTALWLCGGWLELCCPRRRPHLIAILVGPPLPAHQILASLSVAGN